MPERLDALLLLQRTTTALGYDGRGDFFVDPLGGVRRRREREVAPYLFAGVQILHRRLFDGAQPGSSRSTACGTARSRPAGCARSCMTASGIHVGTPRGAGR